MVSALVQLLWPYLCICKLLKAEYCNTSVLLITTSSLRTNGQHLLMVVKAFDPALCIAGIRHPVTILLCTLR